MPKSTPVSVRPNPETQRAARELARRTSRFLGSIVSELAEEALRMRRHPGIVFAGPPGSRRARVEGSGLDAWEVISVFRDCGEDAHRTLRILTHLTPRQLEAAVRYANAFPEEIESLIAENRRPIEEWQRLYPHVRASTPGEQRVRPWLDEMISPEVARQLRALGHDVLGVQEPDQAWARGLDDVQQLETAVRLGWGLVSFNLIAFMAISHEWTEAQRPHLGVILVHHRTVPQDDIGGLVRRLARFLDTHPAEGALADQVMFLPS